MLPKNHCRFKCEDLEIESAYIRPQRKALAIPKPELLIINSTSLMPAIIRRDNLAIDLFAVLCGQVIESGGYGSDGQRQ